jgi:hypothetical protein
MICPCAASDRQTTEMIELLPLSVACLSKWSSAGSTKARVAGAELNGLVELSTVDHRQTREGRGFM